jgi:DNA-binding beta-propeller fold protein YncE
MQKIFISAAIKLFFAVLAALVLAWAVAGNVEAAVDSIYQYHLSNFNGPISVNRARIHLDEYRKEIYILDPGENDIRVFNERGMEVFQFNGDNRLASIVDVTVDKDGNILVLSRKGLNSLIIMCDFRGNPVSELALKGFPPEFSGFTPDYMVWHEGRLYLLDSSSMRIAITESNGLFLKGYDLVALLKIEEKKRNQTEIGGFSLDRKGNILFTVPVMFTAYTLSPEGIIKGFGEPGSAPGKFGIVGGIVADDRGNYYVADQLKCVVSIFDKDFNFQKQFGYRGGGPQNLIGPKHLELDDNNMLYVSQLGKMGVSVFRITYNQP